MPGRKPSDQCVEAGTVLLPLAVGGVQGIELRMFFHQLADLLLRELKCLIEQVTGFAREMNQTSFAGGNADRAIRARENSMPRRWNRCMLQAVRRPVATDPFER